MIIAHDIFSETNPAFCAIVLAAFTKAFVSTNANGPELPVVYLSLPIALSGDLSNTFDGTNKKTGLLEWLSRNPQAQIGFTERVNKSMSVVTKAIQFGCFSRVLILDEEARLHLGDNQIKNISIKSLSEGSANALKRAERLGYWFAAAGSTKTVFDMMDITV